MSANNWRTCLKCEALHNEEIETFSAQVEDAYGKIPVADWDALRGTLSAMQNESRSETFREDYELGVWSDGTFSVSYSGSCDTCGFKYRYQFEDEEPLKAASEAS